MSQRLTRMSVTRLLACAVGVLLVALTLGLPQQASAVSKKKKTTSAGSFSIQMLTPSVSVTAGDQAAFRVAIKRTGSFNKTISFDVPDLPPGSQATVTKQSSSTYTLLINTSTSSPGGTSSYVLRGRSGSVERIAVFRLTVNAPATTSTSTTIASPSAPTTKPGDFAISTNVLSRTVNPGDVASYTVIVNRQNFTAPVTFTMQGAPAGVRADAAPNPTTLGTTLYLTTSTTTPSGTYLIVVTATSGSISHSIAVRLVVNRTGPFVLAVSPASGTVTAGNDATTTITVGRTAGSAITPQVELALLDAPAGVQIRTLTTVGATTQVVIATAASTAAGTYKMTIAGTSGAFKQGIAYSLTVQRDLPTYAISVTPQTVNVVQGMSGVYEVKLVKSGGFADPIAYSVKDLPPGAVVTVTPSADGSASISIATSKTTPASTYPMSILASSGQRVSSVGVSMVVTAPAL